MDKKRKLNEPGSKSDGEMIGLSTASDCVPGPHYKHPILDSLRLLKIFIHNQRRATCRNQYQKGYSSTVGGKESRALQMPICSCLNIPSLRGGRLITLAS
jgi:hypothetical protein